MHYGEIIKKIREEKGLIQKEVASKLGVGYTNYNKMERGYREPSVKEIQLLAKLFNITVDQLLNYEGDIPKEVSIKEKKDFEKLELINQLEEEDKSTIFKIIDTMLTKKKFKDFFQKNVASF